MSLKELPPFFPSDFFDVEIALSKKKGATLLPDFSHLLGEESFAKCSMSCIEGRLELFFDVKSPFVDCFYPAFSKGDALEIMIDTRNIKSASVMHKFGHHFVILPKEVDGLRAVEITKFHGEDKRPLADPSSIVVESQFSSKGYQLKVVFEEGSLFGFDPAVSPKIGFAFQLHRTGEPSMHFSVSSKYFKIEKAPALWATIHLT